MSVRIVRTLLMTGALAGSLIMSTAVSAEKLYRWTDESGVIHYSDKVPPQASKQERHLIDDAGRTREILEAQKTEEQLAEEERRREEAKVARAIAKQQAFEDRLLLDTYSSLDYLLKALDGRVSTMESMIGLKEDSIISMREALAKQRKQAANLERRGVMIGEKLQQEIDESQNDIETQTQSIVRIKQEIETTKEQFALDIDRYKRLTKNR